MIISDIQLKKAMGTTRGLCRLMCRLAYLFHSGRSGRHSRPHLGFLGSFGAKVRIWRDVRTSRSIYSANGLDFSTSLGETRNGYPKRLFISLNFRAVMNSALRVIGPSSPITLIQDNELVA